MSETVHLLGVVILHRNSSREVTQVDNIEISPVNKVAEQAFSSVTLEILKQARKPVDRGG